MDSLSFLQLLEDHENGFTSNDNADALSEKMERSNRQSSHVANGPDDASSAYSGSSPAASVSSVVEV